MILPQSATTQELSTQELITQELITQELRCQRAHTTIDHSLDQHRLECLPAREVAFEAEARYVSPTRRFRQANHVAAFEYRERAFSDSATIDETPIRAQVIQRNLANAITVDAAMIGTHMPMIGCVEDHGICRSPSDARHSLVPQLNSWKWPSEARPKL